MRITKVTIFYACISIICQKHQSLPVPQVQLGMCAELGFHYPYAWEGFNFLMHDQGQRHKCCVVKVS